MNPFTLYESLATPLVIDSAHSGRIYPVDFLCDCPMPLLRQVEDAYVDELIIDAAQASTGATVLMAEFPRTLIDLNRAEDDVDPTMFDGTWTRAANPEPAAGQGYGLVRTICRPDVPLYKTPLSVAEVERRIDHYYRPYHAALRRLVKTRRAVFGLCFFVDVHSMPDYMDDGVPRVDFVLGDRDGTTCHPAFTRMAALILRDMGYSIAINAPYKGREIVKRYGLGGQGAHALQLEINRRLYMNEVEVRKHGGFNKLRADLGRFWSILAATLAARGTEKLAAE